MMNTKQRSVAPDISVVIPTIGRRLLKGCLDSIAVGSLWPFELIVVDQGSNPDVSDWIRESQRHGLNVRQISSSQSGIAAATNRGLEQVRSTFVALTHDDCRVRPDWLEKASARVREIGESVLTGRVEPEGEGMVLTTITSKEPITYTKPLLDRDVLFPPNMAFPLRLLDRVGYFDEHSSLRLAGEDNEWAYRALRSGVRIVYVPTVVVSHLAWQEPGDVAALYRRYARGQGSFYGKYLRRGDLFIARRALRDLVRAPWLLLRGAASRNPNLIAMGRGEITGILPGIVTGMRRADS
jgi:GT2 family glycosyltransferase